MPALQRDHPDAPVVAASWTRHDWIALAGGLILGLAIRLVLLPTEGFRDDLDQFVGWVHHIATNGLGSLYGETDAGPVTFGPVMAYLWAVLAAVEPDFRVVTDASDVTIRVLMKLPAVVADVGLALLVAFALRHRPRWATIAAVMLLLHPALLYVGAWWGQVDSVYVALGVAATLLALRGRPAWAAVILVLSLMTKPQALPFVIPIVAWIWATGGASAVARAAVAGAATALVLWLPFIASGGPAGYLSNLATYQESIFNILSVRAWNVWWLVQEAVANGGFIADDAAILGPITWRHLGYGIVALLELVIAITVVRNPRPRTLVLGLAASVLVVFGFATQMHERYAFGAIALLALLVEEPRLRWLGVAFAGVFTANLLAAVPPAPWVAQLLPVAGLLGVAGSIAMLAITFATLRGLGATPLDRAATPAPLGP